MAGRGRASLNEILKNKNANQPEKLNVGRGRANLLNNFPSTQNSSSVSSESNNENASPDVLEKKPVTGNLLQLLRQARRETSGESNGVLGSLSSLSIKDETKSIVSSEPEVINRQGESGKPVNLSANYINLIIDHEKTIYQYEVKFIPNIDSTNLRRRLLAQHGSVLGSARNFDGSLLYLPKKLDQNPMILESVDYNQSVISLKIIFKKKQAIGDNVSFFNILMNRVLKKLQLVRIGRHNFNQKCALSIPQHRLDVWPGYITAINEYEGGLKLNLDATHRVMRQQTVRDLMKDYYQNYKNNFKNKVINEVIGTSVITMYNNRTYKIDDIDWDKNPTETFIKDGKEISLIEYYQLNYNIDIQDKGQPLLVHRSKEKKSTGETTERMTLLIPELSFLTGITDQIRSDFNATRDLANVTKIPPNERRQVIRNFIQQVNNCPETRAILSDWGLRLEDDIVKIKGRRLPPENIKFGENFTIKTENAEWNIIGKNRNMISRNHEIVEQNNENGYSRSINQCHVLRTPNIYNWCIICPMKERKYCEDFLTTLKIVCKSFNIELDEPVKCYLRDDSIPEYHRELRKNIHPDLRMVVVIMSTLRQDKYSAIKRTCCVDKPIPSQVIVAKTISKPQKLKSVTERITLQINCKLGGALWSLNIPFSNCMVVGIDVYHSGTGSGIKSSVAALVASLDKNLTQWHSRVCLQRDHQEMIDLLRNCFTSSLETYRQRNGVYPDKIFVFRDGVGDGQLEVVKNYEVKQFLEACTAVDPSYKPKLSVIIVQKRINTRIFEQGNELVNPLPGTIVDHDITRRYLYDFFLVPQRVNQGTVTPTHYIVLYDGSDTKTDHMQRFTFKLCHLYYNWPGTIRVPAPCQYAHKLAYLIGQSVKAEPHRDLTNLLYYL